MEFLFFIPFSRLNDCAPIFRLKPCSTESAPHGAGHTFETGCRYGVAVLLDCGNALGAFQPLFYLCSYRHRKGAHMENWIDILIMGQACPGFEKIMDRLMANYDSAQVYEVGAPGKGVNPQVAEWAFKHRYPLVLGLPEDADAMIGRFKSADNRGVVVFGGTHTESARHIAKICGAQFREIIC